MAKIHAFGSPENTSENRAIRSLAQALSDDYIIFHNFELTTGRGLPYEYDIAVVGPFAVWHVEVKGYRGNIKGDMHQWVFQNGRVQPSPIPLANKKSKILASQLKRHPSNLDRVFVDTAILLTDDRARVQVRDRQARRIIQVKDIWQHFTDPRRLPVRVDPIVDQHEEICDALFGDAKPCEKIASVGLYDVTERINQTDTRTVFLAKHRYIRTRPETVLKVFHFDVYESEKNRERQIASIFHDQDAMRLIGVHPNIIDTSDMFAWEHNSFVLPTEYVDGGRPIRTLLDREEDHQVPWSAKLHWMKMIARGLAHCHEHGVVHRDVRPLSVVVSPEGVVKIVNFDLALIRGTPHPDLGYRLRNRFHKRYVAPEIMRGPQLATPASDVYSLGILFHAIIASKTPYADVTELDGDPPLDVELLHSELATPDSEDFMHAPEAVISLIRWMTRYAPDQRPQSMTAVMAALDELSQPSESA